MSSQETDALTAYYESLDPPQRPALLRFVSVSARFPLRCSQLYQTFRGAFPPGVFRTTRKGDRKPTPTKFTAGILSHRTEGLPLRVRPGNPVHSLLATLDYITRLARPRQIEGRARGSGRRAGRPRARPAGSALQRGLELHDAVEQAVDELRGVVRGQLLGQAHRLVDRDHVRHLLLPQQLVDAHP